MYGSNGITSPALRGDIVATLNIQFSESRSIESVPGVNVILFASMVCDIGLLSSVFISNTTGSTFPFKILMATSSFALSISI